MLKNSKPTSSFIITLLCVSIMHFLVLFFVKKSSNLNLNNSPLDAASFFKKLKLDNIDLIKPSEIEKYRHAGIKGGKKEFQNPDSVGSSNKMKGPNLNFQDLGYNSTPKFMAKVPNSPTPFKKEQTEPQINNQKPTQDSHFFNYKKQKYISANREHNTIKTETLKNLGVDKFNSKASNISNFDIRVERPEGVSEDQLNSDEKAFYSFYKRTYMNYVSKLFSTYEDVRVTKPGIDRDFEDQHLLIAKIDYDEHGNIITIKILRSSNSDNVHYFFEEALKKLNIPNPPKIFLTKQKQFSVYYQIHIN